MNYYKLKPVFSILLVLSFFSNHYASNTEEKETKPSNLYFIENKGQWNDEIQYKIKIGSNRLFLMDGRLTYQLLDPESLAEKSHQHGHSHEHHSHEEVVVRGHNFTVDFVGANDEVKVTSTKKLKTYHNYFLGNDPSKWADHVGLYQEVVYEDLYSGIDLKFYLSGDFVKYDYILQPNTDPSLIKMKYDYADSVYIKDENLHVLTSVNELIEQKPYAYQEIDGKKVEVTCRFKLDHNQMGFDFPNGYNTDYELIIDPILVFASYSGATDDNWGMTATFDEDGNTYGGGFAFGSYPTTPGAFDTNRQNGFFDPGNIGVSKFSSNGRNLIYSTFIGGNEMDVPHSMIVNSKGELIVLSSTSSSNFPTTTNAFDNTFNQGITATTSSNLTYNSGSDIGLTVLNSTGSALIGSTYVGGSDNDGLHTFWVGVSLNYSDEIRGEVIIDEDDNIYVASTSASVDFPISSGTFDVSNSGIGTRNQDGVVFKMNPTLSRMDWATYLGGSGSEAAFSLRLDNDRNIYVVGMTSSNDFAVSADALHTSKSIAGDGFVAHIKNNGQELLHATYLINSDFAYFVDLDENGFVYVLGQSALANYAIEGLVYFNPRSTMFLHKLNPELSQTDFSTILGNGNRTSGLLVPSAFLVDECKRIYISGWGGETALSDISDMPVTSDAFQSTTDGSDFYLMVLNPDATDLQYATYFGGDLSAEHVDGGTSRFDKKGIIYQAVCAGCGGYSDFPVTNDAYSTTNNASNCNMGVFKFDFQLSEIKAQIAGNPSLTGCAPLTIQFNNNTIGASIYNWDFGDGMTSTDRSPTYIFETPGTYTVKFIGSINEDCIEPDSAELTVIVNEPLEGVTTSNTFCQGAGLQMLSSTVVGSNVNYNWSTGTNSSSISVENGGVYWVDATVDFCTQRDSFILNEIQTSSTVSIVRLCKGTEQTISSSNTSTNADFEWNDGTLGNSIVIDQVGTYFVTSREQGCTSVDSFIVIIDSMILDALVLDIDCIGQDSGFVEAIPIGGIPPYEYSLNNADFTTVSTFDGLQVGSYTLEARDVNGCQDEINFLITSPQFAAVSIDSIEMIELGDSARLIAQTNLAPDEIAIIEWNGFDTDCTDCLIQEIQPTQTSTYSIRIESIAGCTDSAFITIIVNRERPVYIPNVFSPQNDGINDVFFINARPGIVRNINVLRIFDRWGELIFEAQNFQPNDPSFGWDGTFRNEEMNPAVFVYYTEIEFIDGVVELFKGDITLLR